MPRVRPTLRCLRDDLGLAVPSQAVPLDEIPHPLVSKANEQFADGGTLHERIASIDDQLLLKVKIQRWRGAVWTEEEIGWLVAAGWREDGSADDFYTALAAEGTAARKRYSAVHRPQLTTGTHTGHLLPNQDDRERYDAEAAGRVVRRVAVVVQDLVRASLRDGREHTRAFETFTLGVQVRADHGHETYVAVRVAGSVPQDLVAVVLNHVPGCDPGDWEYHDRLPDRPLRPGEVAYFNLMDPVAAAKLLDTD